MEFHGFWSCSRPYPTRRCVAEVVYGYAAWIHWATEPAKQVLRMDDDWLLIVDRSETIIADDSGFEHDDMIDED